MYNIIVEPNCLFEFYAYFIEFFFTLKKIVAMHIIHQSVA